MAAEAGSLVRVSDIPLMAGHIPWVNPQQPIDMRIFARVAATSFLPLDTPVDFPWLGRQIRVILDQPTAVDLERNCSEHCSGRGISSHWWSMFVATAFGSKSGRGRCKPLYQVQMSLRLQEVWQIFLIALGLVDRSADAVDRALGEWIGTGAALDREALREAATEIGLFRAHLAPELSLKGSLDKGCHHIERISTPLFVHRMPRAPFACDRLEGIAALCFVVLETEAFSPPLLCKVARNEELTREEILIWETLLTQLVRMLQDPRGPRLRGKDLFEALVKFREMARLEPLQIAQLLWHLDTDLRVRHCAAFDEPDSVWQQQVQKWRRGERVVDGIRLGEEIVGTPGGRHDVFAIQGDLDRVVILSSRNPAAALIEWGGRVREVVWQAYRVPVEPLVIDGLPIGFKCPKLSTDTLAATAWATLAPATGLDRARGVMRLAGSAKAHDFSLGDPKLWRFAADGSLYLAGTTPELKPYQYRETVEALSRAIGSSWPLYAVAVTALQTDAEAVRVREALRVGEALPAEYVRLGERVQATLAQFERDIAQVYEPTTDIARVILDYLLEEVLAAPAPDRIIPLDLPVVPYVAGRLKLIMKREAFALAQERYRAGQSLEVLGVYNRVQIDALVPTIGAARGALLLR